jgi:glycosyltransferase involved in cell wall biosynthesis
MADRVALWLTKGLGLGGAERLLILMAPKLDPERFDVEVAYQLPWKDAFVGDLQRHEVPNICLGAKRTTDLTWVRELRRLLGRRRYAIVHTHSPVRAAAARLMVRPPTSLVHTEHNVWDRYRWPTYAANVATYRRNDAVFTVSDGVTASIRLPRWAAYRSLPPVETLLHGVEPDLAPRGPAARCSARSELGLVADVPVVGCVANFPQEGPCRPARRDRAGPPLSPRRGPAVDRLGPPRAGAADQREWQRAWFDRALGSRDDVPDLLPGMDVFVLSSRFEGLPISLLEAMAAEVACVSTAVGGIPEGDHPRRRRAAGPGRGSGGAG